MSAARRWHSASRVAFDIPLGGTRALASMFFEVTVQSHRNGISVYNNVGRASAEALGQNSDVPRAIENPTAENIKRAAINVIRRKAELWLKKAAIKTIIASIPSGGVGGTAVMSTELGQFVVRAHRILKPIIGLQTTFKTWRKTLASPRAVDGSRGHVYEDLRPQKPRCRAIRLMLKST